MSNSNCETTLIDPPNNIKIDKPVFQKMMFLTNALDQGWNVRKSRDSYIFTKKHENRKEIFREDYLETFIQSTGSFSLLLCKHSN